jgi:hypothetical protein
VKSKNSPESLIVKILELDPIEFLGICKIVGVDVYEDVECGQANDDTNATQEASQPREFTDIWSDLCDTIESMNRVRRRNLGRLIYAATKKEKEK